MRGPLGTTANNPSVSKGMSSLTKKNPPGVTGVLKDAYQLQKDADRLKKGVDKWISRWKEFHNPNKKAGVVFDCALEGLQILLETVFKGAEMTNIFFSFYEPYFEILKDGLTASLKGEESMDSYDTAYSKIIAINKEVRNNIKMYKKGGSKYVGSFETFSASVVREVFRGRIDGNNVVYALIEHWNKTTRDSFNTLNVMIFSLEQSQEEARSLFARSDEINKDLKNGTNLSSYLGNEAHNQRVYTVLKNNGVPPKQTLEASYQLSRQVISILDTWESNIKNMVRESDIKDMISGKL